MKKMMLIIFTGLLSLSAHSTPINRATLDNLTIIKLNNIQENHLSTSVNYPGKNISGSCSIVIRSRKSNNSLLKKLADKLQFSRFVSSEPVTPDSTNNGALVLSLKAGTFIDGIDIKTKDGRSIAENISSIFPATEDGYNDVGLFAGVCA